MTDTHTHLYMPEFDPDRAEMLERAEEAGVRLMILPNVDEESMQPLLDTYLGRPDLFRMVFGLHPTELKDDWRGQLREIREFAEDCPARQAIVAVGEIGVDLYWDATYRQRQMEAFAAQLDWAAEASLPVIIHSRDALEETVEVLCGHYGKPGPHCRGMVMHSFTGSPADVEYIRSHGLDPYFGINGVITFKNAASLREALPLIGADRIVLETDSPYLAPVPHRGKRNESAWVARVRDAVAERLAMPPEEIERITDNNAQLLFKI